MDHQEEAGLPLDGNAASGLLSELFALDVTVAEVTCDCCGAVSQVGYSTERATETTLSLGACVGRYRFHT
jgi:Family of unknown function (DUF6510)